MKQEQFQKTLMKRLFKQPMNIIARYTRKLKNKILMHLKKDIDMDKCNKKIY
jgi:hypothetical protein